MKILFLLFIFCSDPGDPACYFYFPAKRSLAVIRLAEMQALPPDKEWLKILRKQIEDCINHPQYQGEPLPWYRESYEFFQNKFPHLAD